MNNNTNTNNPHPHAELIKAWADGAKIQYRVNDETDCWEDCNPNPGWCEFHEYRIKPEEPWKPKEGISYLFVNSCGHVDFKLWESNTLDERHYKIGNCFHLQSAAEAAAERVKAALKGELKISAPNDEKIQLDGKPLSDGEKALIRALRNVLVRYAYNAGTLVVYQNCGNLESNNTALAINIHSTTEDEDALRDAINLVADEQIQTEQEEIDE